MSNLTDAQPPYTESFLGQLVKSRLLEIVLDLQRELQTQREKNERFVDLNDNKDWRVQQIDLKFERANEEIIQLRATITNMAIELYGKIQHPHNR